MPLPRKPILPAANQARGRAEKRRAGRDGRDRPDGLGRRPSVGIEFKAYQDRLATSSDMIEKMGFSGYFLIVADFIQWPRTTTSRSGRAAARARAPWSPGRSRSLISTAALGPDLRALPQSRARVDAGLRYRLRQDKRDRSFATCATNTATIVAAIITFGKLQRGGAARRRPRAGHALRPGRSHLQAGAQQSGSGDAAQALEMSSS